MVRYMARMRDMMIYVRRTDSGHVTRLFPFLSNCLRMTFSPGIV